MKRWFELGIKDTLSKKRLSSGLKEFGRLRFQINHTTILSLSALLLILFVALTIRLLPIRWEIPSGTVHLNEFDPYYQLVLVRRMVQNGLLSLYWPTRGIDLQRWYPDGMPLWDALPSLPMTAAISYDIVSFLGVNIDLMTFCAFIPPIIGTLGCLLLYFIGKDFGGKAVGLLAALFLALEPSVIERTALGFFDTEVCGIVGLLGFILTFLRAIDLNRSTASSLKYSIGAAAALTYFIAGWGAAYYMVDLAVLFVFVLLLLKRYNQRLLISYSIVFGIALAVTINVPYFGFHYLTGGAVIPVAGVFLLLCLAEVLRHNISARTKLLLITASLVALVGSFVVLWQFGDISAVAGKFASVLDPITRSAQPLIESVAEHRVSAWGNIYYELGIAALFFLAGLYFTLKNPTTKNVFLILFGVTSLYFAASMVRLFFIFASAFALLAAIGILGILKPFYTLLRETPNIAIKAKRGLARVSREYSGIVVFLIFILVVTNFAFSPQSGGMPRVYDSAYMPTTISAASLPITPTEPLPQWLDMLSYTRSQLNSTTVVCAWWDYGDWLSILGNVTTLADNATINNTKIENIGFIMMANETQSLKMLEKYNATYILVFVVLRVASSSTTGYYSASFAGLGDEGKWMWMARISGEAKKRLTDEGFMDSSSNVSSWTDETTFSNASTGAWYDYAKNSTIYKLMSWAKQRWCDVSGQGAVTPDAAGIQPTYFNETYFAGEDLGLSDVASTYQGLIPLVCLYQINWQAYYNATSPAT